MEIEFLDPGPEELPAAGPGSDPGPPERRDAALRIGRRYAPAVLWAAAAALALAAPFRVVDTITVHQGGTRQESTDGWGRYRVGGGAGALSHGPRYGILLAGCAALLLAAAALALLGAVRPLRGALFPRLRSALGIAGAGGLAAFVAALLLNHLSTKDTLEAQVKSFGSSAPGTLVGEVITADVRFGGCFWLAVAALAAALLAIPADLLSPDPAVADKDEVELYGAPDEHPQEDLLESGPPA